MKVERLVLRLPWKESKAAAPETIETTPEKAEHREAPATGEAEGAAPETIETIREEADSTSTYFVPAVEDTSEETDAPVIEEAPETEGLGPSHEADKRNPGGTGGDAGPSEEAAPGLEDAERAEFPDSSPTTDAAMEAVEAETEEATKATDLTMEEAGGSDGASDPAFADEERVEGESEPEHDHGKAFRESILQFFGIGVEPPKEPELWRIEVPKEFLEEELQSIASQPTWARDDWTRSDTIEDPAEADEYCLDASLHYQEAGPAEEKQEEAEEEEEAKEEIPPDVLTEMDHVAGLLSSPDLFRQPKEDLARAATEWQGFADEGLPELEQAMAHAIVFGGHNTAEDLRGALISFMDGKDGTQEEEEEEKDPGPLPRSTRSMVFVEALNCVLAALEATIDSGVTTANADDPFWRATVACLVREIEREDDDDDTVVGCSLQILRLLATLDPNNAVGPLVKGRLRPHLLRLRARDLPLPASEATLLLERFERRDAVPDPPPAEEEEEEEGGILGTPCTSNRSRKKTPSRDAGDSSAWIGAILPAPIHS